mmetsp:Transcript_159587/g.508067  ORF Transcript_159587/g.508067 Transcript_159587/m.508067 type:complete len:288 (+) Transcript_159587:1363-2226(+)
MPAALGRCGTRAWSPWLRRTWSPTLSCLRWASTAPPRRSPRTPSRSSRHACRAPRMLLLPPPSTQPTGPPTAKPLRSMLSRRIVRRLITSASMLAPRPPKPASKRPPALPTPSPFWTRMPPPRAMFFQSRHFFCGASRRGPPSGRVWKPACWRLEHMLMPPPPRPPTVHRDDGPRICGRSRSSHPHTRLRTSPSWPTRCWRRRCATVGSGLGPCGTRGQAIGWTTSLCPPARMQFSTISKTAFRMCSGSRGPTPTPGKSSDTSRGTGRAGIIRTATIRASTPPTIAS